MHFVVDGFFLCASRVTDARIAAQKRDNIKQKGGKKTTEAAEEPQTDAAAAVQAHSFCVPGSALVCLRVRCI